MSAAGEFYLDLLSTESVEEGSDSAQFKVKLDPPLELSEDYEVALTQVVCPANPSIVSKAERTMMLVGFPTSDLQESRIGLALKHVKDFLDVDRRQLSAEDRPRKSYEQRREKGDCYVRNTVSDTFNDPKLLIEYMSQLASNDIVLNDVWRDFIDCRREPDSSLVYPVEIKLTSSHLVIKVRDPDCTLLLSGALARCLGFDIGDDDWVRFKWGVSEVPIERFPLEPNAASVLGVHSNIVGSPESLLRVCSLPKERDLSFGAVENFEFLRLNYLDVKSQKISDIEITFRDQNGNRIRFVHPNSLYNQPVGVSYVRLHFRPKCD